MSPMRTLGGGKHNAGSTSYKNLKNAGSSFGNDQGISMKKQNKTGGSGSKSKP